MARLRPDKPFIHSQCEVGDATFGRYVEIGRGSRLAHAHIGDYSYCDGYCDIANTAVG
jgi:hypothetical protein